MSDKNKNILDAFWCSIDGLKILFQEKAARRELLLLLFSILYIFFIRPDTVIFVLLMILPILILSIEALNTAIEYTCDKITTKKSDKIKKAKDLGSAAIFLALVAYSVVVIIDISKLF